MNTTEYLAANAELIDQDSAARIEQFNDTEWAAVLDASDELNGSSEPGIDCKVVTTAETLPDFDAARMGSWSERGGREEFSFAGLPAVKFSNFQTHKGARRFTQIVIDTGAARIILI